MFICHSSIGTLVLLLYVDDIILTGSNSSFLTHFIQTLSMEFEMKDLGPLHYFLGIQVTPASNGLFLSQSKYAADILHHAQMVDCKPTVTPMTSKTAAQLDPTPYSDPSHY